MKVQVSHRLDEDLLSWATEYGESRRVSRAVVLEEALRVFRDLCTGGVADLPGDAKAEEPVPKSRLEVAAAAAPVRRASELPGVMLYADSMAERQRRLNAATARARAPKGKPS